MSVLSDFTCPIHGRFEALADRDADHAPCPLPGRAQVASWIDLDGEPRLVGYHDDAPGPVEETDVVCNASSPWTPSPVAGRVELVSAVSRGKWEPPPHHLATNTRPLMEGQKYSEWRAERKKVWRDHDHKQRKERG